MFCLRASVVLGLVVFAAVVTSLAAAEPPKHGAAAGTEPVLMVSDIHFDPFRDPGKVAQLRAADVAQWEAILSAPDTPTQTADYMKLMSSCSSKGLDTDWKLFASSLRAEKERVAHPFFITLSGDLTVHQFECRFHATGGANDAAAYAAFAAKIVAFVTGELRKTFPGAPLYFALGNNDSGCRDYQEDAYSEYLKAVGRVAAETATSERERELVARQFSAQGNYTMQLPGAMRRTEIIVMQNVFEAARFHNCKGAADDVQAKAQISWLRGELEKAREKKEPVWVMAHMPPGVDPYATMNQHKDVCKGDTPAMFLSSGAMAEVLDEYADVVKLAIFAHTHMDEMRLFRNAGGAFAPGKLVPSISPVNGNRPAFTVAKVNPGTATVMDYSVTVATDNLGTAWNEEYVYSKTYGEKDFSGASLAHLATELPKIPGAGEQYVRFYSAGDKGLRALGLGLVWPQYSCSIAHVEEADYRRCACPAGAGGGVKP
jgi:sphingomyelin phosphodiesterase acid-like 3